MKAKIFFLLWSVIILTFSISSCTKEEELSECCDCTAPETQTVAGTLSFDINGKTWSPCNLNSSQIIKTSSNLDLILGYPYLEIRANQINKAKSDLFYIAIRYPKVGYLKYAQVGDLRNRFTMSFEYFTHLRPELKDYLYYTNTLKTYSMEITKYDTVNNIISGRFFCEMKSYDKQDSIKITNGRFDVPIIK